MVDGTGTSALQEIIDGIDSMFTNSFTDSGASAVAGFVEGRPFWLIFDKGLVDEWQDPDTGVWYTVRPLDRAYFKGGVVVEAAFAGFNEASMTILIWDGKRGLVDEYSGVTTLRPKP